MPVWTRFYRALTASVDLLLPPACLLCGRLMTSSEGNAPFCPACLNGMPPLGSAHCPCCARPYPAATSIHLCGTCLERPPAFSVVHAAGLYQGAAKDAVHRLKYRNQLTLAKPLGQLIGRTVGQGGAGFLPHCIVPVPLHPRRLRKRGYNQALELARPLARQLKAPLETGLLQRVRHTPPQQELTAAARNGNVHRAFALTASAAQLTILLVDDVMTTGATARECSRVLRAGGAAEVRVAVFGRA
jgi:ComF family protein